MKKIILLTAILISVGGCSSYKFIGNPIKINSKKFNTTLSGEELKGFIDKKTYQTETRDLFEIAVKYGA